MDEFRKNRMLTPVALNVATRVGICYSSTTTTCHYDDLLWKNRGGNVVRSDEKHFRNDVTFRLRLGPHVAFCVECNIGCYGQNCVYPLLFILQTLGYRKLCKPTNNIQFKVFTIGPTNK